MDSTTSSTAHSEITHEDRLALSQLLFDIYAAIDHTALATAQGNSSPNPSVYAFDQETDTEMSDASNTSEGLDEGKHPEELTMPIVLSDALQYFQLLTFGTIISSSAPDYSLQELVAGLARFLDADGEGVEDVRTATAHEVEFLRLALRTVLSQLERGNSPFEPVARLYQSSYATASYTPSHVSNENIAMRMQRGRAPSPVPFFIDSLPSRNIGAAAPASGSRTSPNHSPSLPSYHSSQSPEISAERFSNCSVAPYESASNVRWRPSTASSNSDTSSYHPDSRMREGSTSPVESNCSIAPSESCSNIRYHSMMNHLTWKRHPYRSDRYEDGLPPVKYIFGVGGGDFAEYRRPSVDRPGSATEWTEVRRVLAQEMEQAAHLAMFEEEEEEEASFLSSLPSYSDYSSSLRAPPPSVADVASPRLALGMGRVEGVLPVDATEADRVEFALYTIDQAIDRWFAEN